MHRISTVFAFNRNCECFCFIPWHNMIFSIKLNPRSIRCYLVWHKQVSLHYEDWCGRGKLGVNSALQTERCVNRSWITARHHNSMLIKMATQRSRNWSFGPETHIWHNKETGWKQTACAISAREKYKWKKRAQYLWQEESACGYSCHIHVELSKIKSSSDLYALMQILFFDRFINVWTSSVMTVK